MAEKSERKLKVYGMSGYNYKLVPTIMLKGTYLEKFGFRRGDQIHVRMEEYKIIIEKL